MTISKAYGMLEAEGLLERQRGIGMIVSNRQPEQLPVAQRISLLEPAISKLANDAKELDIDSELVIEAVRRTLQNN